MTPFTLPPSAKPRGLSSAPVTETFAVGGLLPGLQDIPYVRGDFPVGGKLYEACCTFWSPDTEDRLILGAGGVLQILTFAKRPAVQQISAALIDAELPEMPVIQAVARYLYEQVHRSEWELATVEAQENWSRLAQGAYSVLNHWNKASKK